ncbi:hypothetical protein PCANC_06157 [Puccinia coronata f. sp. avenae]|uniref:Peptidase A2 domain-containing protein n=1 Tax=Puccinia coronata f. sp. avenae TaxID=200324 RepID=A0A2N5VTM3_9BASI|nr:hypothetical protein PCANC_06157 [Puccinia coronata f. sp. avenae]
MAPYPQDKDLENILPLTNPSGSGGIFPGSLNMNIDPPSSGIGAGHVPTPPPPPPVSTYCTGKPRTNLRTSPAYQKQKAREQEERNNQKDEIPTHSGEEQHHQQEQYQQQQQNKPATGTYGLQPDNFEDFRPRPAVIIKEPDLKYKGDNFKEFLDRFELAAEIYGAGDFDKACQVCRFVKGEDLKKELESMEGYDNRDWKTLRKSMLDVWGGSPLKICYTIQDLYDLIKLCQEHIPAKTSVSHLFFLAFPREYQVSINQELVKSDLIPTGKDGYNKPPILEDVMEVAEDEVRAQSINAFEAGSTFAAANKEMQKNLDLKKGDGKKQEKMLEEYPKEPVQSQMESMAKAIEALASKLNAPAKAEYSRGNEAPSGRLYEPRPCSYCHCEGHNSAYCHEAQKDEREGLVKRDGKFFNLPSGKQIPWDPSRPIRSVVATESAKPKPKINAVYATDNSAVFQISKDEEEPLDIRTAVQHKGWDPPKLGSEEALKNQSAREEEALKQQKQFRMEANAATTRAEAMRGQQKVQHKETAMDIDREEPSKEVIAEVPATRRTPGRILEAPQPKKDKPSAEAALLSELDNMKMPNTFSQLTAISPTYVEELIKKLQNRIPGPQASKLSYIKEVGAKTHKVAGAMIKQEDEEEKDCNCFYSCALGYIETRIKDERVPFMIDSGLMVNVIPAKLAIDLELEVVEVDIPMRGVGGERCDINRVVENCDLTIGRFTGPVHLFVAPQAQECILGQPFLFDYDCTLDYPGNGVYLQFQGDVGRRITVPIARVGKGTGWNQRSDQGIASGPSNNRQFKNA